LARKPQGGARLPSKEEVRRFIVESPTPVGKREVARAFNLKGAEERQQLKALIRELREEGAIDRGEGRRLTSAEGLPEISVIEVTGTDSDGELLAKPHNWRGEGEPPLIYLVPDKRSRNALDKGERVLARLTRLEKMVYEARIIRVIGKERISQILGVYDPASEGGRLHPTDRRAKGDYVLRPEDAGGAQKGELVLCEVKPRKRPMGLQEVRVIERIGDAMGPNAVSLIAIHEHEIPTEFPEGAVAEAEAAGAVSPEGRTDLRKVPLVTIDGADARDFDDAVWAEPDENPKNPGGWHLMVAIADVAHYVRSASALDKEAETRGNSVYFPDRVVPMLPEALSNGWCSLRPDEERGCLVCEIWIDSEGKRLKHRFLRGIMRSVARLTYEQVQEAVDGSPDALTAPLVEPILKPLYGAFAALLKEREARGTLDLDIPERKVVIDAAGKVTGIEPRQRLDSHRLIEEFMITANVAAAVTLEERQLPCMYRVHESPDPAKVEALRQFLDSIGLRLAKGQVMRPKSFEGVLRQAEKTPYDQMVNDLVLRCQSQAYYSGENLGHFGLGLPRYAHFTSPIRRYSDLLVHRSLIKGLKLGEDGLTPDQQERFESIGEHISTTERRAAAAERQSVDRYTAAFLAERVGEIFPGRINGVTRFGLFITLNESGADGLVPISSLPNDYYLHVEEEHALVGRRWGRRYRLGEAVAVRLLEVNPVTGGIVMELLEGEVAEPEPKAPSDGWDPLGGARRAKQPPGKETPGGGKKAGRGRGRGATRVKGKVGRAAKGARKKSR
jgi:ribonuclease R